MATVYRTCHIEFDRHATIRIIHQSFLEDKHYVMCFKREAQIIAGLEHANSVPIDSK